MHYTSGESFYFFFQAEDGIRDIGVTGVQTCALPIWLLRRRLPGHRGGPAGRDRVLHRGAGPDRPATAPRAEAPPESLDRGAARHLSSAHILLQAFPASSNVPGLT